MEPQPPIRAPHYFWNDDGPATLASAQFLPGLLCDFARLSPVWNDRAGREIAVSFERQTIQVVRITLSGAMPRHIWLSAAPGLWAWATACLGGTWFGRGWIERYDQEREFWPHASGGIVGPQVQDDPQGISKSGCWMQFDTTQWPGHMS